MEATGLVEVSFPGKKGRRKGQFDEEKEEEER